MSGFNAMQAAAYDAAARQRHRQQFQGLSAWDRHKKMVHDLATYYGRRLGDQEQQEGDGPMRTDFDVLREAYRFIRTEADDVEDSWEVRLAKRYYSKLFREFCIADLSRHKEGRVGLRWRTQREVVAGKGQFICGALGCEERRGLASFEVPFAYKEAGEHKQALVKVRLCPTHAYQLNYRKHKEAEEAHKKRERKEAKRAKRRKRRHASSGGGSDSDEEGDGGRRAAGSVDAGEGSKRHSSGSGASPPGNSKGMDRHASGPHPQSGEAGPAGQKDGDAGDEASKGQQQQQQQGRAGAGQGPDEFDEFFQGLFG